MQPVWTCCNCFITSCQHQWVAMKIWWSQLCDEVQDLVIICGQHGVCLKIGRARSRT